MKGKRDQVLSFLLITAVLPVFCIPALSFADKVKFKDEYKLTLNVAQSFYWGMGAAKFADLVKEKTNGAINEVITGSAQVTVAGATSSLSHTAAINVTIQ